MKGYSKVVLLVVVVALLTVFACGKKAENTDTTTTDVAPEVVDLSTVDLDTLVEGVISANGGVDLSTVEGFISAYEELVERAIPLYVRLLSDDYSVVEDIEIINKGLEGYGEKLDDIMDEITPEQALRIQEISERLMSVMDY